MCGFEIFFTSPHPLKKKNTFKKIRVDTNTHISHATNDNNAGPCQAVTFWTETLSIDMTMNFDPPQPPGGDSSRHWEIPWFIRYTVRPWKIKVVDGWATNIHEQHVLKKWWKWRFLFSYLNFVGLLHWPLVGGFNPVQKNAQVKLDHFSQCSRWKMPKIFEGSPPKHEVSFGSTTTQTK